ESEQPISASQLWHWLTQRHRLRDSYGRGDSERIQQELRRHPGLLKALFDVAVDALRLDDSRWRFMWDFRQITANAAENADLLDWMAERAQSARDEPQKQLLIYENAIALSFGDSPRAGEIFEQLYEFGKTRPDLAAVRDRSMVCVIQDWHRQDARDRVNR